MWRRRPLCFPRRTPGGRTSRRDAGRRRPVPQSPGTGVVAAGRPGATSAQARAWYETDTSSWVCKPTSRTTVAPLASGLPRLWPLPQGGGRVGMASEPPPVGSSSALVPRPPPARVRGTGSLAPQRRPGHDVRQRVMSPGLLRQVGAAAMRPPLASRATGSRRGAGCPRSAVGLPARLWPRGSPRSLARPQPTGSPVDDRQEGPSLVHSPTSTASRGPALTGRPQRQGDGTHARRARSPERVRACTAPPASAHGAMTGRRT
jgi:hypothetical protein